MSDSIRELQNKLTENTICNSFLKLLLKKSFEKITVADICREANINRGTFYLHYCDINELVEYINSWYIEAITPICFQENIDLQSLEDRRACYKGLTDILLSWPEYSIVILGQEKGQTVIDKVIELAGRSFLAMRENRFPEETNSYAQYLFHAELYGTWAILRKWCHDGLKESQEQIISILMEFHRQHY